MILQIKSESSNLSSETVGDGLLVVVGDESVVRGRAGAGQRALVGLAMDTQVDDVAELREDVLQIGLADAVRQVAEEQLVHVAERVAVLRAATFLEATVLDAVLARAAPARVLPSHSHGSGPIVAVHAVPVRLRAIGAHVLQIAVEPALQRRRRDLRRHAGHAHLRGGGVAVGRTSSLQQIRVRLRLVRERHLAYYVRLVRLDLLGDLREPAVHRKPGLEGNGIVQGRLRGLRVFDGDRCLQTSQRRSQILGLALTNRHELRPGDDVQFFGMHGPVDDGGRLGRQDVRGRLDLVVHRGQGSLNRGRGVGAVVLHRLLSYRRHFGQVRAVLGQFVVHVGAGFRVAFLIGDNLVLTM